eukprot:Skav233904  [mRNA]  locus=scaffold435:366490:367997:- [translate_table: standard]
MHTGLECLGFAPNLAMQDLRDGRHFLRGPQPVHVGQGAVRLPQHVSKVGVEVRPVAFRAQEILEVGVGHTAAQDLLQFPHVSGILRRKLASAATVYDTGQEDVKAAT